VPTNVKPIKVTYSHYVLTDDKSNKQTSIQITGQQLCDRVDMLVGFMHLFWHRFVLDGLAMQCNEYNMFGPVLAMPLYHAMACLR
jgi:hypothetical protein